MRSIDWGGVRERLVRLAPAAEPFMWRELEPVLTGDELGDLQRQLGVELPEDYRQFLLHVGRGGPGPAYGILPVRNVDGRWAWHGDGYVHDPVHVAEPFPLRTADWYLEEELEAEEPDWFAFARQGNYQDALEVWHRRHAELVYDPRRTHGAVPICDEGCALREWLVVTGPERGNVWLDHRADGRGLTPAWLPHHRRVTFAQWYLHWLEAL